MLNFRYHIVSLVAVFLALGVGVIMGSAVIDSTTIDVLEDQSAQLEDRLGQAEGRVAELQEELRRLRAEQELLAEQGGEVLLDERLDGVPVVLITAEGVDGEPYEQLRTLLTAADAELLGTITVRDRLALAERADRAELAEILGRSTAIAGEILREGALTAVVRAVTGPAVAESPPEVVTDEAATVRDLADAGFVQVQPAEGSSDDALLSAPAGTHIIVMWGPGASTGVTETGVLLTRLVANQPATPVVVTAPQPDGEVDDEAPVSLVEAVRSLPDVADAVSTVDNVDTFAGRLACALALEAEGRGEHGHYGTGEGAHRLLPAAPQPAADG